ncbi:Protein SQS1 [Lachnellula subtilissima]|uniref:Protein SQS1 n=1 Tax=Lachnellula subtilissima TaxID=602034 RepID=A0A8H8U982_9HELO|nr:Protein SQS1 [Lachnellula subtilissima]
MPSKPKKAKALQQKARATQRGNGNGSSYGARSSLETSCVPFDGAAAPRRGHNGFTLQEEARNTERHQSSCNTDQRLRYNKVNFVSAGTLDPRELEEDPETTLAEMTLDSPREVLEASGEEPIRDPTPVDPSPVVEEQSSAYFVVDTLGEPVNTGLALPRVRSTSPTPSNSSEEVILFGGRDPKGKGISRERKVRKPQSASIDTKIKIVEDQIHVRESLLEEVLREKSSPPRSFQSQSQAPALNQNRSLPIRGPKGNRHQTDEDAIIADYIANMEKDDDLLSNNTFRPRELGDAENAVWQDEMFESSEEPIPDSVEPVQGGWERSDICDFDELSTSDEVMGTVQEILSKRERESGVQYLVVWEHQTTDDARWVPVTTLTAIGALSLIELFEAEEKLVTEFMDQGDEDTSESEDDADVYDSGGDEEDDDLVQRKIDRMSDEQIARMLTKQEELGMGSRELLLFGDEADAGDDIEDNLDMDVPETVLDPFLLGPTLDQYSGRGARRPRGDFPSASALADSYDGFDVMDFDRPSLKKKPKGRKGKISFDLSDSEFEASMQVAFENDRLKKKARKQERDELRAQGLLGNKNGKPDLKQKFKEGMSIHDVKDQIKGFLMGSNTTLSLPPMAKADRKVVHELAAAFNLKSKSVGGGKSRAPILTRTSRTPRYLESTFDAVEARLSRRYLPRMDVGHKQRVQRAPRGGNNAGVSYRDGDIVGGSAPELGVENRGRAMLEKMGWSTGTALGALNNKGILQPVSHVVKTTKAGLG